MIPSSNKPSPPPLPPENYKHQIAVNLSSIDNSQAKTQPSQGSKQKTKKIFIIIAVILLALVALMGALFFIRERQDIREEAATTGRLVCMPVDNNGNITNEKYQYDRMLVKNETNRDIQIKIQTNLCPYQGQNPQVGYRCDDYVGAFPYIVRAGTQVILPNPDTESWLSQSWVGCQKIGQMDIQKDKDHYIHIGVDPNTIPDCFNTVDNRVWEGGIAFTIKANSASCCPKMEVAVSPNNPRPGQEVIVRASSPSPLVCAELVNFSGLAGKPTWIGMDGNYNWSWRATAGNTPGQYSLTFRGNTRDSGQGVCPGRAIGDWCQVTGNFGVGVAPTPTPTPTPTIFPTPTPTPTPTPPQYDYNCHTINVYDANRNLINRNDLKNLKAGDLIYIGVVANSGHPIHQINKARIRVNRNYWLAQDETSEKLTTSANHLTEFVKSYIIPEGLLNFKIEAEVHLNAPSPVGGWR